MRLVDTTAREPAPAPEPVRVNGKEISRAAIAREIQNHPAPTPADAAEAATRALVVRELLLQEAARLGLDPDPQPVVGGRETDEDALVRALIAREVIVPTPTDAECRRVYARNTGRIDGSFEDVRNKIADYLADAVFHRAVHQYVSILAGRARIEGIDLTGATSPLVQ